ncbi:MAG: MerR family transcriptional regulator [Christensenellales bacterium]|jgi:DNA-binding transcriptional MerR regulator
MDHERLFTVGELAKRCGVTVRTLQFYDRSGLLTPSRHSDGGRRLYGMDDMLRLQQILFYKGFGFSLEEIRDRLMDIASAQDFADVLLRQRHLVEKQIEYLRETVALMDKTAEEIRSDGDISMDMVVAILSATKQGNFFAFVMKYFEREELEALIATAGSHAGADLPGDVWTQLLLRLKALHGGGEDPQGPKGQQLAKDWWDMVMMLTGGDPQLVSSVLKVGGDMESWPQEVGDVKTAIQEFLSPALGHYFIQQGIALPGMEDKEK